MDITLGEELTKHLLPLAKNNPKLAQFLAQQFLDTIDKMVIANYLLGGGVALAMLTERLEFKKDPDRTLGESQALAAKRGRKSKRQRLTADQGEQLKGQVREFLGRNPWSTRKQISSAVPIPSEATYARIMGELKEGREVVQKGTKGKATYALRGTKGKATGKAKAARKTRAPLLCPYPRCKNKAAPVFGMMCREHKDVPKRERQRMFAARRAANAT